ncbi:calcineurin-like phosphoesterase [Purpureocillium lavendulum]|uniref:Calcineurin-like phosphoesterase n=1 Tax=Purpureocillium lavendulum TaxID=1247861 RepID=A0AB34FDT9_9HYPO|nr:calcineurin-like phosphoesterase [Purpureocillium lavendulum]
MSKALSILQVNVRKREPVQQSLMNNDTLKDYGVLAVAEPYARLADGKVITSPMWQNNWTGMMPTRWHDALCPIRSMLWVRSDIEAEQVSVPSADITAAVLRLPERDVLVVSVYVQGKSPETLISATGALYELIGTFRDATGRRADVVLAGDFNRHVLLWTGDDVSILRQGEAEPIVDLMAEHGLRCLLPRGTKTWQGQGWESTIDLVLATSELAGEMVACVKHLTDHGSDHRAIQTTLDVELPERRWWTGDLTRLHGAYTFWRNRARAQRRAAQACPDLERRSKEAAKEYHDAIRSQKKAHWEDFLSEGVHTWKAAKYPAGP